MKVLLAFLLIVTIGSVWEVGHDRPPRSLPLLAMCAFVAVVLFGVSRFI